jgi:hypothetical protein
MWGGHDPALQKELQNIREMVKLSHQSPTRGQEWLLVFVAEFDALLVVREWAGGNITAYAMSKTATDPR